MPLMEAKPVKLEDIAKLIDADVLSGEDKLSTLDVCTACGADLMSDVLAFCHERTLLLTGLASPQVVRSAEVAGLSGIVFVRGKKPGEDVLELAEMLGIPLLATDFPMFEACGMLYAAGIGGTYQLSQTDRGSTGNASGETRP
jgi:predicted transcriptional regulator